MNTPLKYPGSKWSYAGWICSYIPAHRFYLEPYFGSGAVFFNKSPAPFETINDLDSQVVNFFRVCRDFPEELARLVALTPFSREEFRDIQEENAGLEIKLTDDPIENARRFAVRCSQGFGSRLGNRTGWKNTKRSSGPINPTVWDRVPGTIMQVATRLKNAQIENTDAIKLILDCNAADCLIYADPPYPKSTRNGRLYRCEMLDPSEHKKLLDVLLAHKGPVMLSGYDNPLYNDQLKGWDKSQKKGRANSAQERVETLWMNFEPQGRQERIQQWDSLPAFCGGLV